jgi:hypothetical protein
MYKTGSAEGVGRARARVVMRCISGPSGIDRFLRVAIGFISLLDGR